MLQSRLGVGRKFHHRPLCLRTGGVNALLRISLFARCLLNLFPGNGISWRIPRTGLELHDDERVYICWGLGGDDDTEFLLKLRFPAAGTWSLCTVCFPLSLCIFFWILSGSLRWKLWWLMVVCFLGDFQCVIVYLKLCLALRWLTFSVVSKVWLEEEY